MSLRSAGAFAAASMIVTLALGAGAAHAQDAEKGGSLLAEKCLQCHSDAMWRDQRQSARAWEATLFRMVGRGATWEIADIKAMAAYLGANFGPDAPRAPALAKKE